uniref:Uncharacterized protein n=1 Tax=Kalanchoe fedtschenkoi TaxID=63787 RepID=A0A7N0T5Y4_KALFE
MQSHASCSVRNQRGRRRSAEVIDGSIPPFNQDSLAVFNVSSNNLDGQIPGTSALRRFSKSSFDKITQACVVVSWGSRALLLLRLPRIEDRHRMAVVVTRNSSHGALA